MSPCIVEQRRSCTTVAAAVADHDHVVAVDVLQDVAGGHWGLEVVCDVPHGPSDVLAPIVGAGLDIHTAQPQGVGFQIVAAA